jgi:multicomponent Na+:H+ antiporter subunit D
MTKIWAGAFWGAPEGQAHPEASDARQRGPRLMVGATAALVIASLGIAVAAGPIYELSERAAGELLAPAAYIEAVLAR